MEPPFSKAPELDPAAYEQIRKLVHEKSGINLRGEKATLVAARLSGRVQALGLESYHEYIRFLGQETSGEEMTTFLDSIATNVTCFFREPDHFAYVLRAFTEWKDGGQTRFRFWCAAASSGEEPYSLGMVLEEHLAGVDYRLLATDLSTHALARAIDGTYSGKSAEALPRAYRKRYMKPVDGPGGPSYEVSPEIRKKITFRQLNLTELPFPLGGPLDVILCRNVMIYFDQAFRSRLVGEFHRLLKPDGVLIVSHSESLVGIGSSFRMIEPSIYRKVADLDSGAERAA